MQPVSKLIRIYKIYARTYILDNYTITMHPTSKIEELPIERALRRMMRSVVFSEAPLPAMDALPLAQMRLLWVVHSAPDITMKAYSERMKVSQSTLSQLTERLEKRGLAARTHDITDRRIVRLSLTQAGREMLEETEARHRNSLHAIWKMLSKNDQEKVMAGLELLSETSEQYRSERELLESQEEGASRPKTSSQTDISERSDASQPVVDLLTRRVRGR